jgi:hypothetical protein
MAQKKQKSPGAEKPCCLVWIQCERCRNWLHENGATLITEVVVTAIHARTNKRLVIDVPRRSVLPIIISLDSVDYGQLTSVTASLCAKFIYVCCSYLQQ